MKPLGIIIVIILYLSVNYYVFQRMWVAMPPNTLGRIILISFAFVAVSSLFFAFLLGNVLPVWLTSVLYKIGTSWFFILLYFFIVILFKDILALINRVVHFMPTDALSHYTRDNWIGLGFMIGFIFLVMTCGYLKYQWKVRVELPITTHKTISSDSTFSKPLRIVAISDMHLGYTIGKKEFESWVDLINAEHPDIVIIAGDIIDNNLRPLNALNYAEVFKKINAPKGIYACLGNHEYISGVSKSISFINKAGIHLLRDSVALLNDSIYIVGRDDKSNTHRKPLSELMAGIDKSKFVILLDHQPYHLEEGADNGVDLQFSGHTHQGQIWPISMVTKKIYENDHGLIHKGNTAVYVSSGIGLWGGKFRIGTQSEYVVIDVNKK